jgi:hypothetical protein
MHTLIWLLALGHSAARRLDSSNSEHERWPVMDEEEITEEEERAEAAA